MSVKVKFKNGLYGMVSMRVAEILEKRKEVEIVEIEDKQPELGLNDDKAKAEKPKRSRS